MYEFTNEEGTTYTLLMDDEISKYLTIEEMKDIYLNIIRQVKVGGYFCMTVADTKRNSKPIYFVAWLKELFIDNGWEIVEDEMRQLERQSMGQKRIPEEHILVLKRIK